MTDTTPETDPLPLERRVERAGAFWLLTVVAIVALLLVCAALVLIAANQR